MKGKRSQAQVVSRASGLKTLARSVGRHSRSSIARQVVKDDKIRGHIIKYLSSFIQKEMRNMSRVKTGELCFFVFIFYHIPN